jgi:hypothetical protein
MKLASSSYYYQPHTDPHRKRRPTLYCVTASSGFTKTFPAMAIGA